MSSAATAFAQSFFHGTRADLKPGDLIVVGHQSNFIDIKPLSWVYFAATLDLRFENQPSTTWRGHCPGPDAE
nr:NAD(+)--rifampin ADP-ribosyltransferase [Bradyrhizobium sp. WSM3983]